MSLATNVNSTTRRIAIIGRPNVGKSTLFNIMTGTRNAVVKNQPGVTRDIQIGQAEVWGKDFEILDTGGITDSTEGLSPLISQQVKALIPKVDMLLVVLDGKAGICAGDNDIVRIAKVSGKDFLVIVNKVDSEQKTDDALMDFYELGVDLQDASFEQRRGMSGIYEWIFPRLEVPQETSLEEKTVSLAIVGIPIVGKSSLFNRLVGEDRVLVSEVAGTTVDAIDSEITFEGKKYIFTDTAGLRRNSRRQDDVEIISAFKSHDAIDRSDIVLLMIDGLEGPSEQDAKILSYVLEKHKGVVVVVNKSDRGEKELPAFRKTLREKIPFEFHFFSDIPVVFVSALTGNGLKDMFNQIDSIWEKLNFRVSTSELNQFFTKVIRQAPAPVYGIRNVKFYYLTQTNQVPPSFIAFANFPAGVDDAYRRFLAKRIQEQWGLEGVPIRIFAMKNRG